MKNIDYFQLITWFSKNYPEYVQEMKSCTHNFTDLDPNPFHAEGDVWTHLMMTLGVMNLLPNDRNAKLALFFHDLGKPSTFKVRDNLHVFKGHEVHSAFLTLNILEKHKDFFGLTDYDLLEIFLIISHHINFHKIYSKSVSTNSLWPFVEFYKGTPQLAEKSILLGIADSLGRIGIDPDFNIFKLLDRAYDEMIFDHMVKSPDYNNKPIVEVLIGLPGSGKSTYAKNKTGFKIISRDEIIMKTGKGDDYQEKYLSVEQSQINTLMIEELKETIIKQENFILDNTSLTKDIRGLSLKRCPHYHKRAIFFVDSLDSIFERNKKRDNNKNISKEVLLEMSKVFQIPDFNEFDEIVYLYKNQLIEIK